MKNILKYIFAAFLLLTGIAACEDEKVVEPVIPSDISNLRSESTKGGIKLLWDVPADSNLFYVEVIFTNPRTNKVIRRQISKYADSLLVQKLLLKNGPINFKVRTWSETKNTGTELEITATPLAAPIDTIYHLTEYKLSTSVGSTNAQEASEGPLANLFDGSTTTFFHSSWSVAIGETHRLEFDLGKAEDGVVFKTNNRANGNNVPQIVEIWTSNDKTNWTLSKTISSGIPTGASALYTSPVVLFKAPSRYMRYIPTKISGGTAFFALSEFKISTVKAQIIDPELGD